MAHPSAAHITSDVPKFDVVEAVTPVGTAPCAECRGPIADTYYEVDEGVICAACHTRVAASLTTAASGAGFARATLFGVAGAALAVATYFVVSAVANRDAVITLVIAGFMVGKAVRMGAGRQRGRQYQWLAVALTYLAIATTYVPFVMKGFSRGSTAQQSATIDIPGMTGLLAAVPATVAEPAQKSLGATGVDLVELTALAFVAPLLESTSHPLNFIVLAGALLLAWRTNARAAVRITGPYRVRATTA